MCIAYVVLSMTTSKIATLSNHNALCRDVCGVVNGPLIHRTFSADAQYCTPSACKLVDIIIKERQWHAPEGSWWHSPRRVIKY